MSIPSPDESPSAYDTVYLGTLKLPGFCVVKAKVSAELTKAKPKGKNGGSVTFQGANPGTLTIKCSLPSLIDGTMDFDEAVKVLSTLKSTLGDPYDITHPIAQMSGISRVIVESWEIEHNGQDVAISFALSEFLPTKKSDSSVTKTPKTLDPRNQALAADLPTTPALPSASGVTLP